LPKGSDRRPRKSEHIAKEKLENGLARRKQKRQKKRKPIRFAEREGKEK